MKKLFNVMLNVFLMLAICLSSGFISGVAAEDLHGTIPVADYVKGRIVIFSDERIDMNRFSQKESVDFNGVSIMGIQSLLPKNVEASVDKWIDKCGKIFPYVITIDSAENIFEAKEKLQKADTIISADLDYILSPISIYEEDSQSIQTDYAQWSLTNIGADIAWGYGFVGSSDIKVAVLDAGFSGHEDLEDNLDMSLAYDVYDDDEDVTPAITHGNAVASVIGADYDDGGINGVCQNVTIIPVKIGNNVNGNSSMSYMVQGVSYAISQGASVINLSYAMSDIGPLNTSLNQMLEQSQVLLVTASGNDGVDLSSTESDDQEAVSKNAGKKNDYPYWIVVGASNSNDGIWASSNYSAQYVDLFAPGADVVVARLTGHSSGNGTSFASPHVAAACALIMSHAPQLTPLQVKQMVLDNVRELIALDDKCVSGGILSLSNISLAIYDAYRGEYTKGDVDGDGYVNQYDYILCRSIVMNEVMPTQQQLVAADTNGDGAVDQYDYILIRRYVQRTLYFPPY